MGAEGDFLELSSFRMETASQSIHPHPVGIQATSGLGPNGESGLSTGQVVIVPPRGEQGRNGLVEHRMQHGQDGSRHGGLPRIGTVTQSIDVRRCPWCSEIVPATGGPGRPRKFCRRSHRQRHYEARRLAAAQGIAADEVLLSREVFDAWRDQVAMLASAVEDADQDLGGAPGLREYTEAFQGLYAAALATKSFRLDARAIGSD